LAASGPDQQGLDERSVRAKAARTFQAYLANRLAAFHSIKGVVHPFY